MIPENQTIKDENYVNIIEISTHDGELVQVYEYTAGVVKIPPLTVEDKPVRGMFSRKLSRPNGRRRQGHIPLLSDSEARPIDPVYAKFLEKIENNHSKLERRYGCETRPSVYEEAGMDISSCTEEETDKGE